MKQKKQNLLTKESYTKLITEMKELEDISIPNTLEQLKDARESWDLSENYEYHSAKEKLNMLNIRLNEIKQLVKDVKIVTKKSSEDNKQETTIQYWSKIVLSIEWDKEYNLEIVGVWEVEVGSNTKISFESPIWMAIEWKKQWDSVKYKFSDWNRKNIKILSVK